MLKSSVQCLTRFFKDDMWLLLFCLYWIQASEKIIYNCKHYWANNLFNKNSSGVCVYT